MKIVLVAPPMPFTGRVPIAPPILEYLGALTLQVAPHVELELIDAGVTPFQAGSIDADLVGISAMTATAPWAYEAADVLRAEGVQVVLGGIHPTAVPDEAAMHADSVVVGEAESVWEHVITDAQHRNLQGIYVADRMPLDHVPTPLWGALEGPYRFRAITTARGCPYRCTFCSVRRFFGDTVRLRPIDDVVADVAGVPGPMYFNADDNIWGVDVERSIRLFRELSVSAPRPWYGFGDLRSVQGERGDELIRTAKASGLFSVWAGWEGDAGDLATYHASAKQGSDREGAIRRLKDAGIDVVLFVVLGGRQDSFDQFERTVQLADRLDVGVHPVLLTPFPGTELFDEYSDSLIPGMGWDCYSGVRAVFEHPDPRMTPLARERAYYETSLHLLSLRRIIGRALRLPRTASSRTRLYSVMKSLPLRRAMRRAYVEWKSDTLS